MSGQLALRPVKVQGSKPNLYPEPAGPMYSRLYLLSPPGTLHSRADERLTFFQFPESQFFAP